MTNEEYLDREFVVDDLTIETHKFVQHPEVPVTSGRTCHHCGHWPLHHVHTGNRAACLCSDAKCRK